MKAKTRSKPKPDLLTRKTLGMAVAEMLVEEAVKASRAIDRNTVVAVCDESGILKAFRRPDFTESRLRRLRHP